MNGKGLKVLVILLDLVFLTAMAGAVYLVFFTNKLPISRPEPLAGLAIGRTMSNLNRAGFTDADIRLFTEVFGSKRAEPVEVAVNEGPETPEVPEESTEVDNLVLIGVIMDTEAPEDSVALIFDREAGEQKNLFIGEEYKGWRFDSIKDRITVVLVKGEERIEVTKTTEPVVASAGGAKPGPQPGSPNMPGGPNQPGNPSGLNPGGQHNRSNPAANNPGSRVVTPSAQKKTIPRSFLEQISKDRDKYIQQVFAKPFYEAGRPIGMEVTKIEQNSPLRYFGIQPGDVILNWNGQVINSEKKCYEIMNQYSGNINSVPNSNNITLIRNGTKVNLTIDLR